MKFDPDTIAKISRFKNNYVRHEKALNKAHKRLSEVVDRLIERHGIGDNPEGILSIIDLLPPCDLMSEMYDRYLALCENESCSEDANYSLDLTECLHKLIPQIIDGEMDRFELHPETLDPIVATRNDDIIWIYHFVNGEIHECPCICIKIDPETNKAQTISYHVADVGWYKNVNDYDGEGKIKNQNLLDEMACEWICGVIEIIEKNKKDKDGL